MLAVQGPRSRAALAGLVPEVDGPRLLRARRGQDRVRPSDGLPDGLHRRPRLRAHRAGRRRRRRPRRGARRRSGPRDAAVRRGGAEHAADRGRAARWSTWSGTTAGPRGPTTPGSRPRELGMGWMLKGVRDGSRALRRQRRDPPGAGRGHLPVGDHRDRGRLGGLGPAAPRRRAAAHQGRAAPGLGGLVCATGDEQVGYVTSFFYSPVLQRHVGLARVRPAPRRARHRPSTGDDLAPQHDHGRGAAPRRCRSSTPPGRRPARDRHQRDTPRPAHVVVVRRHRRRRRPQRPRQRRLPGQGRAAHARARAAAPRRRRGHHRGAAARLLVHDVLLRAQPAAARDHPRARAWSSTGSCP